ncbi:Uncharacterised protein [Mycoplasmopsis caviae]|uniref:Uncharacterized protein n=1 Tax=Mycoplasmopsis caviae TaxID=55603 RepID=A0A3P8MFE8_9BACT|nr:Uncharacterised protein [Mycoplasmopsis caviae]
MRFILKKYNLNISIDVSENNNWEEDKLLIQVDEQNKDTINNIIDIIKNKLKMFSLPYELSLSLVSKKVIKTQQK